jgi:hypothetical protein
MTVRIVYNLTERAQGDLYSSLLRTAAGMAATFGVIIRSPHVQLSRRAHALLDSLAPYRVSADAVTSWPGTQLVGGRVSQRHLFRLVPESLEELLRATDDLFMWVNPLLPEDLHFLRADGSTVLGSVAQEEDAWLELDEAELQHLHDPALSHALRPE